MTDTEMLDWMDKNNERFKMGWEAGLAPAGNLFVRPYICLAGKPRTIREAIEGAKEEARRRAFDTLPDDYEAPHA